MHKMELKNMSWNKYYSRQTHCYKLTVYWEGERVFKASNDGSGAQTEYFACKDHSKDLNPHSKWLVTIASSMQWSPTRISLK